MKSNRLVTRTLFAAALAAGLTATPAAFAQEESTGPNLGRISFSVGNDFVTQYYFRGLAQENQGFITQPWAEVGVNLYEGAEGDFFNSLDFNIGVWNSIHTGPSGEDLAGDPHYELDFYTGASVTFAEDWTVGLTYTAYTSPNDVFTTTQEVAVGVEFDDSGLYAGIGLGEDFGLAPHVLVAFETEGGADAGTQLGMYLELGIEPSFEIFKLGEDYPVTLSVPVTLGFSLDGDYYESTTDDDFFGYLDVGADFGIPLAFIPSDYGSWTLTAGVHFLVLGDSAQDIAERDFAVDGDADFEIYGKLGISMEY